MPRRIRRFSLMAVGATLVGMLGLSTPAMAATPASSAQAASVGAAPSEIGFTGSAYGSRVIVGSVVQSGPSAYVGLGCTTQPGVVNTNSVASVQVPGELTTGTVDTYASSEAISTGIASTTSATTQGISVLGGLVSATTVQSVSTTSYDSQTAAFSTSAAGTEFLGLSIAGIPISGTPAPNTKITLPGVGYVILNQQISSVAPRGASLVVVGMDIVVTLSTPLAPVGTQIYISSAHSDLGNALSGVLDGIAYGAQATVGNTIIAGREFPQPLTCFGTHGVTRTNSGAAVAIPGILTSGTVTDTAEGRAHLTTPSAAVTSTVEGVNLASGLVTATAVSAAVTAIGNPPTLGDQSSFVGLSVAGFPAIGDNVAPNTKVSLAGLGTLWLHRQIKTANKITVIMVQLVVTVPSNPLGLAVGSLHRTESLRSAV